MADVEYFLKFLQKAEIKAGTPEAAIHDAIHEMINNGNFGFYCEVSHPQFLAHYKVWDNDGFLEVEQITGEDYYKEVY